MPGPRPRKAQPRGQRTFRCRGGPSPNQSSEIADGCAALFSEGEHGLRRSEEPCPLREGRSPRRLRRTRGRRETDATLHLAAIEYLAFARFQKADGAEKWIYVRTAARMNHKKIRWMKMYPGTLRQAYSKTSPANPNPHKTTRREKPQCAAKIKQHHYQEEPKHR